MKLLQSLLLLFSAVILLLSCGEDDTLTPREIRYAKYQGFLDSMVLDCPEDTSQYYFKAIVNGQQVCHYDGVDGLKLRFGFTSKFETPSPSLGAGDTISNARRGARLNIKYYPPRQKTPYFSVCFPCFPLERDRIDYLDSLVSKQIDYPVRSTPEEENAFLIELVMLDLRDEYGGLAYPISSKFGPQDGSYVRFRKVERIREDTRLFYYIEMELACKLYHWDQNGQEGLWSTLEEGLFVAKFEVH